MTNAADVLTSAPGASARGIVVRPVGNLPVVIVGELTQAPGPGQCTTGVQSNVAAANADTLLLALNLNRITAYIFNDPAGTAGCNLYISVAGAASATNAWVKITPGGTVNVSDIGFTGQIRGFWDGVVGVARITEFTP